MRRVSLSPLIHILIFRGTFLGALNFIRHEGLPEVGCQLYESRDPGFTQCSALQRCKTCTADAQGNSVCTPVENYKKWYVKEYGFISGPQNIKKEILKRGPVGCMMKVNLTQIHQF